MREYSINEPMRSAYRAAGIDENFIEKALSYGPNDMWFPSHKEMIDADVLAADF